MSDNIDALKALENDEKFKKGLSVYQSLEEKANVVAEEMCSNLIQSVVKDSENFNISTAILATAKCLTHLASYIYDNETEFLNAIEKARKSIPSKVIPALLDPQPCGICEACKNGHEDDCINPIIDKESTQSYFLPILANYLLEYDLYNKIMFMYTQTDIDKEE